VGDETKKSLSDPHPEQSGLVDDKADSEVKLGFIGV
jgi:hypothetical protein